jgi:hypothetical protein
MSTHRVGQSVRYVTNDGGCAHAALITKVHEDGCACLVYWCPESKAWKEAFNVSDFDHSDADRNEDYFVCANEADPGEDDPN